MSSLFRDLNHAAIDAKLNRNEFMIFNALMSQTLGYGKCDDPLTDKRIAKLTDIRLDRLRPTLKRFVKRGIFQRRPHDRYQYEYFIPDRFFDDLDDKKVYTPHCANSGETHPAPSNLTANGGEQPAKRGHTTTNPTEIHKTPPQQTTKTETVVKKTPPPQKTETEQNLKTPPPPKTGVVEIFFGGLNELPEQFVIQSSEPVRIEFSSTQREQNTTASPETVPETPTETTLATPIAEPVTPEPEIALEPPKPEPINTPTITPTLTEANTIDKPSVAETTVHTAITNNNNDTKPVVVDDKKEDEKKPLNVPKAVGEYNQKACQNNFDTLSNKEKQDVLLVFYSMLKTGTIRHKANYFIGLCKSAKTNNLTLPTEVTRQKKRSAKQIAKQQEEQKRRDLWSDYVCIQRFAETEQTSEKEIAERMGMMEAYEMFGQVEQCAA